MASNRIQSLGLAPLEILSSNLLAATATAPQQAAYGVSAAQRQELDDASESLAELAAAADAAKAAWRAAVQARDAAMEATADAAASMARSIYAHPGITSGLIAAAGLSPRSGSKARLVPTTPVGLLASPQPNGDVVLSWSRAGNAEGVVYALEARVGEGGWRFLLNSRRTRLKLESFAASGVAVWFRVIASANGQVSAPSAEAVIYANASVTPALRLAA